MGNRVFLYTDSTLNKWQGYVFYINNTINALLEAEIITEKKINITLICSEIDYEKFYKRDRGRNIQILDLNKLYVNRLLVLLFRVGVLNKLKFVSIRKCTIFPILNSNFKCHFVTFKWTKLIYWIPDFQHVVLPSYFSSKEIAERDRNIRNMLLSDNEIVLSSLSAFKDLEYNYEIPKVDKIKVLNFRVSDKLMVEDKIEMQLPNKYFVVSNQFWLHKNHNIIINSLASGLLNKEIIFLITGKTEDYRDMNGEISKMVDNFLKEENVILTGFVDDSQLFNIIKNAHAIIQPSFFEGWNTVIEYAQLFNKVVVASNLDVHFEQLASEGFYFEPMDVNGFTKKLNEVWEFNVAEWEYETNYEEKQFLYSTELCKIIL